MNEFDIIRKYFAPLSEKEKGAFHLTDDAAVLGIAPDEELVVTKDAIVEGVHFIGDEPPSLIARKLLRVNLSDLAAMGAKPRGYFLALMLPRETDENWVQSFAEGLRMDQDAFSLTLMGGDTTATPGPLSLSLTALGTVPRGQALRRNGARAGDNMYVTGTIGDAALGLKVASGQWPVAGKDILSEQATDHYLLQRYQLPCPRVETGQVLRDIATACMDISDGLMQDLQHIAWNSGVGATVEWARLPLSDAARKTLPMVENPYEIIAAGGDDYELLFTASPEMQAKLQVIAQKLGVAITLIGSINNGGKVKMIDKSGNDIYFAKAGYNHF